MGAVDTSDIGWLTTLRDECEGIASRAGDHAELQRMHQLFDELPSDAGPFELLAAKSLALQTFGRIANRFGRNRHGDIYESLTELAACDATDLRAAWQRASMALLRIAVRAGDHAVRDPRLLRALVIIRARYVEPTLNLTIVSRQSGISTWQLSRLMTRCTGRGFMSHVHATRVQAAERLLLETSLSVKEIAAAVGYRSTTQMDRKFKRTRGGTPSTLRRQMIGAPSNGPNAIPVD